MNISGITGLTTDSEIDHMKFKGNIDNGDKNDNHEYTMYFFCKPGKTDNHGTPIAFRDSPRQILKYFSESLFL